MNRRNLSNLLIESLLIIGGELLNAYAFNALIVPARLLSGGVVGISLLLNQLLSLPIGLQTAIYNIPIFILGYRMLGRRFILLSFVGVASFSILTDNLKPVVLVDDILLVAIFGGILTGIADGLILRAGGSTGGFDILGVIVSKRISISIGQVFLAFNGILITFSALVNGPKLAMYTLISLFVSSRVVDGLQAVTPRRVALVVSMHSEAIAVRVLDELGRGATYLEGSGAFTDSQMKILMCVITRFELTDLKRLVREVDPNAFTVILDASDVLGRFDRHSIIQRILG